MKNMCVCVHTHVEIVKAKLTNVFFTLSASNKFTFGE